MTEKRSDRLTKVRLDLIRLTEELADIMEEEASDAYRLSGKKKDAALENVSEIENVKILVESAEECLFQQVRY